MVHVCDETKSCVNTIGSFECHCSQGFKLNSKSQECEDINECLSENNECSHFCENTFGNYQCHCPGGLTLDSGGRKCEQQQPKVTEAFTANDEEVRCLNGFISDSGKCNDINECKLEEDECSENQACMNTKGSYLCIPLACPKAYDFDEEIG